MNIEDQSIQLSVLDLVAVLEGQTHKEAIGDMVNLAQHTEKLGYHRYWLTEHHNMPAVISSATSILIGHVLENTQSIRVGSGGIMLPNHAPLVVAEQFGTLETMYPKRVDLGLGRAPGTDMRTVHALRRTTQETAFSFPQDVLELQNYFKSLDLQEMVRAIPGVDSNVPIYILGSSTSSAALAARLGLPYVFAAHFAPTQLEQALHIYRNQFTPSEYLAKPYVMVCVNVVAADSIEEAKKLSTSTDRFYLNVVKRTENLLQPPVDSMDGLWNSFEESAVRSMSSYSFKGDKKAIQE
ncbi:MAG: LLM class flavin-dependent oxidoreductase, partial [Bacilli bacterium]|nr:LLM class flavin-dependent oxidoreductase [Bacilli bacterium]